MTWRTRESLFAVERHTNFQSWLKNKSMPICYFYNDREHVSEYSDLEGKGNTFLTGLQTCISVGSLTKWVSEDPKHKAWEGKAGERRFGLEVMKYEGFCLILLTYR